MTANHEHTPTTEQVRFAATFPNENFSLKGSDFDRWLATITAAAEQRGAAQAWDEGWNAGYDDHVWEGALEYTPNPYRADQMEGDDGDV